MNISACNMLTDAELLALLKQNDQAAFTEIYNRYWDKLFITAGNKLHDLEEAEEIVQDIFISLWNRRESLADIKTLGAYLATCVKYKVIKSFERLSHQQKYTSYAKQNSSDLDDSTQQWLEFDELKERLSALVAKLPEKCHLVYHLSREAGYSQKQIAVEMGISEKTVEAHLGKALKTLRARLSSFIFSVFL
jgi:RNA polymerase sigma-70 factor (family 1)